MKKFRKKERNFPFYFLNKSISHICKNNIPKIHVRIFFAIYYILIFLKQFSTILVLFYLVSCSATNSVCLQITLQYTSLSILLSLKYLSILLSILYGFVYVVTYMSITLFTGQDLLDNIYKYLSLSATAYFGLRYQDNVDQTKI